MSRRTVEAHCTYHSGVSRNFQSNVRNARGDLHRMPGQEIMRGREQPLSLPLSLAERRLRGWLTGDGVGNGGALSAAEESTLLFVTYQ